MIVLLVTGLAALPWSARAYVRTVTESGAATAWKTPCVTMEFSLGAPPPEWDVQGYLSAAQAAGAAWSQASLDGINRCTNVIFTVVSVPDVAGRVGLDYHNRLIFRQGQWCSDPLPKDGSCYDPSALALTSVFEDTNTGEILCDVFDALTVRRPYKPAFPLDRAYSILRQGSGSHFDPAVVHAFFGAESEVLRAHHQYGDDAPERPLPPAVVAARVAHPSASHLLALDAADDTAP